MTDLEQLVDTLLWEGYALYPYTPGATKNATPTPFGIVYPPVYARGSGATHDRMRMECVLADGGRALRRGALPRRAGAGRAAGRPGRAGRGRLRVRRRRGRAGLEVDGDRMALWVHNETEVPDGLDRAAALEHSLLSTHLLARAAAAASSRRWRRRLRAGQHVARARQRRRRRRAGRRDHAPRPPAAGAREPRQPVRLDRDRGGAAAARDGALRRGARAGDRPRREGDDRARRPHDPGRADGAARAHDDARARAGRARGDRRRRHLPPRRHRAAAPRPRPQRAGPPGQGRQGDDRAHLRRLRRQRAARRDRRRRAGPGHHARHPALPVLPPRRSGDAA